MPTVTLPIFSGSIVYEPGTIGILGTWLGADAFWNIVDNNDLPADITITGIKFELCSASYAPTANFPPSKALYAILNSSDPPVPDQNPPSASAFGTQWSSDAPTGSGGVSCNEGETFYPHVTSTQSFLDSWLNNITGNRWTRAEIFSYKFGIIVLTQNNSTVFPFTYGDFEVTGLNLIVQYDLGVDPDTLDPDETDPCCGSDPGNSPVPIDNPYIPFDGSSAEACDGGGLPPVVAAPTDPESWAFS
jgi:hypothetical protein